MLQAGVTDPSTYPCKGDTNRIPLKNRIKSKKKKETGQVSNVYCAH